MSYYGDPNADMRRLGALGPIFPEPKLPPSEQLMPTIHKLNQECSDLETLLDFCNEAAGSGAKEVIRDAHDIMHVLLGGDKTREWAWIADWLLLPTNPRWTTEAWPDVKVRMLDVFMRAGGSLKREE